MIKKARITVLFLSIITFSALSQGISADYGLTVISGDSVNISICVNLGVRVISNANELPRVYDEETILWVDSAIAYGSTLSLSQVDAVDDFIKGLKANGLRENINRFNIFYGNDTNAIFTPLFVSDTLRSVRTLGYSHEKNIGFVFSDHTNTGLDRGLKGDLSSYLLTGFIPSSVTQLERDSTMYGLVISGDNVKNSTVVEYGCRQSTPTVQRHAAGVYNATGLLTAYINDNSTNTPPTIVDARGRYIFQRINASQKEYWKNGELLATSTDAVKNKPNVEVSIMAFNVAGVVSNASDRTVSMYWIGNKYDSAELVVFDSLLSVLQHELEENYIPLYILWGQSNSRGRGDNDSTTIDVVTGCKIYDVINNKVANLDKGVNNYANNLSSYGSELSFADTLSKHLGQKIALFKYGVNNSYLAQDSAQWYPSNGVYFNNLCDTFARFVSIWNKIYATPLKLAGILTVHGESDGIIESNALAYGDNFSYFLDSLQTFISSTGIVKTSDFKIVVARVSNNLTGVTYKSNIRAVQEQYNYINMDDFGTVDAFHYNSAGYTTMGYRFFENYE